MLRHIMERHVAEIDALWSRRRLTVTSDSHTCDDWLSIDERIYHHAAALVAGHATTRALLQDYPIDDDRDAAFAASYPLLLGEDQLAREELVQQLQTLSTDALPGLRDAWMMATLRGEAGRIRALINDACDLRSVSAALILAAHRALDPDDWPSVLRLFRSTNSLVRAVAWRIPRYCLHPDCGTTSMYDDALDDESEHVRESAINTAALVAHAELKRRWEKAPPQTRAGLNAWLIVNRPTDRQWHDAIEVNTGAERCAILGDGGFACHLPELLDAMDSSRPTLAVAAARAYERITGVYPASNTTVLLHDDPDSLTDFDREFVERVALPDPNAVRETVAAAQKDIATNERWNRGVRLIDIERKLEARPWNLEHLDLRAVWGEAARTRSIKKRGLGTYMRITPPSGRIHTR
ncbi:MAG: hypothetical protein AB8G17_19000 [Gammaproteobacteria bacterium]